MASHRWDKPPRSLWKPTEDPKTHWQRRLKQARGREVGDMDYTGILLGRNITTKSPVSITPELLRTHMHVVGATNVGKSFFLAGMIENLILEGHGVCLIDPHGDLYHRVLKFCSYANQVRPELELQNRVIPFDIAESQHLMGFNPVQRNARVKTYQVVALMEAVRKCWGAGSFQETPRLARWLYNTLYAVIDAEMTFLQTYHMVNPQPNQYRRAITARIKDPHIRAEWEYLARIKSDEKREERVESCLNRIRPFVGHETIRNIIGQQSKTINFHHVLSERKVLLVNLAGQNVIGDDDRHLLGTLLVNELLTAAFARREGEREPYYFFIDEFQHFVTKDICEILDGGRKFGLHLVLAHQHLNQLRQKDPEVYFSTLTNARTKVVFGGLIDDDLDVLAKELYTGELNPDEIKQEIWQTKFRPVESSRLIYGESESSGGNSSFSEISHASLGESGTYIPGSEFLANDPVSTAMMSSSSTGTSSSEGTSWASSRSSVKVPFYEMHEFQELSSRSFRSLEEQIYMKKAQMKRQAKQHAAILIPGQNVELVKTPTLEDYEVPYSLQEEFKRSCFSSAGYFKRPSEAEREVLMIEESLLIGGRPGDGAGQPPRDDDEVPWE
ncbi:MAG: DUF87 domain-containing protein [Nitrospiraceae bacterium]|nr:DUF87 domain-containing protein [Nitrospiraceae bacterium]